MSLKFSNNRNIFSILILSISVLMAACGDNSKIKDAIRDNLKDPDSAQFKDIEKDSSGGTACVEFNAKNSMGGYAGWNVAVLNRHESKWTVIDMDGSFRPCEGPDPMIAVVELAKDAEKEGIEMLSAAKNISIEEANKLALVEPCKTSIKNYRNRTFAIALLKVQKEKVESFLDDELRAHRERLKLGSCE